MKEESPPSLSQRLLRRAENPGSSWKRLLGTCADPETLHLLSELANEQEQAIAALKTEFASKQQAIENTQKDLIQTQGEVSETLLRVQQRLDRLEAMLGSAPIEELADGAPLTEIIHRLLHPHREALDNHLKALDSLIERKGEAIDRLNIRLAERESKTN